LYSYLEVLFRKRDAPRRRPFRIECLVIATKIVEQLDVVRAELGVGIEPESRAHGIKHFYHVLGRAEQSVLGIGGIVFFHLIAPFGAKVVKLIMAGEL
jgi:hypothetical protein